jgi:serine/threonine protein kinase
MHRDMKPENILIDNMNGKQILKIGDFGISKFSMTSVTTTLGECNTPAYLTPEVIKGANPTPKVDVWAAGIILYLLRYQRHPFQAENGGIFPMLENIKSETFQPDY